jgi:hypothetical protein
VRRRGGLDESEIDEFLKHACQAAPGRTSSLLEFLAARVLDFAQRGHDPHPQAITWELGRSRCLVAGIQIRTEPVRPFIPRPARTQQAERHEIGQFLSRE